MTKKNKPLYIVTYIIALLCLVAGLIVCLPFSVDSMLVTQLPEAFKAVIGSSSDFSGSLIYSFGSLDLDVGAIFVLLYAVVTVLSIILIIPVCLSKEGKAAKACPTVMEIISVIVLLFVLINQVGYSAGNLELLDIIGLLIAICGTFIILIIQTIADKKGSGVLKCVMALIGIVGVIALLDLTFLSFYKTDFGSLCGLFAQAADGSYVTGSYALKYLLEESLLGSGDYLFGSGTAGAIASWCAAIAVLLVILNAGIDLIIMGTQSTKCAHVFDCVRYALEFILALLAFVLMFVADGTAIGMLLIIIMALSLIATIISIFRAIIYRKPEAEEIEEGAADEGVTEETATEGEEAAVTMEPVATVEEGEAYVAEDGVVHYKEREPYTGPVDSFISRLTESEKKEFAKIFLDKIYGPYENMPDYVVDGDNKEFFDSIFVYLGKFRPIISDGLMRKLYSEKNLLN